MSNERLLTIAEQRQCAALLEEAYHVLDQHYETMRGLDFDREEQAECYELRRGQQQLAAVLLSLGKVLASLVAVADEEHPGASESPSSPPAFSP